MILLYEETVNQTISTTINKPFKAGLYKAFTRFDGTVSHSGSIVTQLQVKLTRACDDGKSYTATVASFMSGSSYSTIVTTDFEILDDIERLSLDIINTKASYCNQIKSLRVYLYQV